MQLFQCTDIDWHWPSSTHIIITRILTFITHLSWIATVNDDDHRSRTDKDTESVDSQGLLNDFWTMEGSGIFTSTELWGTHLLEDAKERLFDSSHGSRMIMVKWYRPPIAVCMNSCKRECCKVEPWLKYQQYHMYIRGQSWPMAIGGSSARGRSWVSVKCAACYVY